jgi:hypothetical protein
MENLLVCMHQGQNGTAPTTKQTMHYSKVVLGVIFILSFFIYFSLFAF